MTARILIILATVPLYVVNSFCDKSISMREGNRYNRVYNLVKFLLCALCTAPLLFFEGGAPSLPALALGALCGAMYAVSKTVMLRGYEASSVAFMTLCHAGGMLLPCLLGHFLWSERLGPLSLLGILMTVAAIVLLSDRGGRRATSARGVLFGLVILATSGGVMILQKIMGLTFPDHSVVQYNVYSFLFAALLLSVTVRPTAIRGVGREARRSIGLSALGSALSLSVIGLVMTTLASGVPSVILFPLFNGSGIILVCLVSAAAFHERLTAKRIAGLLLGLIGLGIINV